MTTAGRPRFDAGALGRSYDVPAVAQSRVHIRELLGARQGETVLDLGCGPGHLATGLAATARVVTVDRELAEGWRADLSGQSAAGTWFFGLTRFATVARG